MSAIAFDAVVAAVLAAYRSAPAIAGGAVYEDGAIDTVPAEVGQALVVDRGSFAGQPAGLIVISTWDHDMPSMITPSALVATPKGDLAVWFVDPTCTPIPNPDGATPLAVSVDW